MTITASSSDLYVRTSAGTGEVTFTRALHSEWIKFRTLWSAKLVALVASVGMIAIGWVASYFINAEWSHLRPRQLARFDPTDTALNGYNLAQLAVGTLGVLLVTGEYTTGMIRATMSAVPSRQPVLWAKLTVYTAITLVLMMITSFVAFLGGQAFLGSHATNLGAHDVLRVVIATGLYLTLVGMLGVAFGALIRNTAGSLATLLGVLLVLPAITDVLPATWQDHVVKYLPSEAGHAALVVAPDPTLLNPWTGMAVLALYVLAALTAAALLLNRRDV